MQLTGFRSPSERAARVLATLRQTFWVLVLGVIALFAFLVALGAFSPWEVSSVSIVVGVLALLWLAHAFPLSRHPEDQRDPASIRARERRGF